MARTSNNEIPAGDGITYVIEGDVAVVRIDLTGDYGRSGNGQGKNITVASTRGNVRLPNGVMIGVNAYKKP